MWCLWIWGKQSDAVVFPALWLSAHICLTQWKLIEKSCSKHNGMPWHLRLVNLYILSGNVNMGVQFFLQKKKVHLTSYLKCTHHCVKFKREVNHSEQTVFFPCAWVFSKGCVFSMGGPGGDRLTLLLSLAWWLLGLTSSVTPKGLRGRRLGC